MSAKAGLKNVPGHSLDDRQRLRCDEPLRLLVVSHGDGGVWCEGNLALVGVLVERQPFLIAVLSFFSWLVGCRLCICFLCPDIFLLCMELTCFLGQERTVL